MQRCGRGSLLLTCTGASGAPSTPRSRCRSDLEQPEAELEGAGALQSQFAQLSALRSPESDSSGSGPSLSGDRASAPGLTLLDLETHISGRGNGDWLRPLLDRDFDSPRAISSFTAEKNPCFRSITAEAES